MNIFERKNVCSSVGSWFVFGEILHNLYFTFPRVLLESEEDYLEAFSRNFKNCSSLSDDLRYNDNYKHTNGFLAGLRR